MTPTPVSDTCSSVGARHELDVAVNGSLGRVSKVQQERPNREEGRCRFKLRRCAEARPGPLARMRAQTGCHRVDDDVPGCPDELLVRLLNDRTEAIAEEMCLSAVPAVESLRVSPVQLPNRAREPIVGDSKQVMAVIRHQREREACEVIPRHDSSQAIEEIALVGVVSEEGLAVAPARKYVIHGTWDPLAFRSRHAAKVLNEPPPVVHCATVVTLLARSQLDTKRCLTPL